MTFLFLSFVTMMFGQVLRLIGAAVFVFSTLIFGSTALECESGGSCYFGYKLDDELKFETKTCSDSCVYFKCFVGDYKIMEGAGCFEDFVNTCKYVDPQLLKEIKSSYQDYSIYNHSLVLASCNYRDGCAKKMFDEMIAKKFLEYARRSCTYPYLETDECLKEKYDEYGGQMMVVHFLAMNYGHRRLRVDFAFEPKFRSNSDRPYNGTCEYDNTPKQKVSQVKCETKGWCKSGGRFKYDLLKREVDPEERRQRPSFCGACAMHDLMNDTYCERCLFETKTCDACSKFLCTFDGKEIISGHGCFEDFERMCGVVMNETIKNELGENRKNYFYADENVFMVACSDSDDCQFDAFRKYFDINYGTYQNPPLLVQKRHSEICYYKPIVIPPTTTTITTTESPTTTTKTSSTTTTTTTQSTTETISSSSATTTTAVSATTELVTFESTTPTTITTTNPVPFESTSQQKEEEGKANINNLSVSIYASFYLMFLVLIMLFA